MTYTRRATEKHVEGRRLGRHVHHDSRSLAYKVIPDGTVESVRWERRVPVFDQGNLGSCTGNAAAGVLGTDPHYDLVNGGSWINEDEAVKLYSAATRLDPWDGEWEPDDTGSDGLSVAKACKAADLISGYVHITSLDAAKTAIRSGPFIIGSDWYEAFDYPSTRGYVWPIGQVRGGHEYECVGYDAELDLWELVNSWGPEWGLEGRFYFTSDTFTTLLSHDGDATSFVPIDAPAPVPVTPDSELAAAAQEWLTKPHPRAARLVAALRAWLDSP